MAFLISVPPQKTLVKILLASKFYSLMGTFARGLFNLSSTPKDSCKNLAQILLTNGTFASGLFNLGASNGLLKTFGSSLSGLCVSSFYTTGTSHMSLVMDREW